MDSQIDFHGAKVAFFIGNEILVYRRDNKPDIPFPDMLDLPGGGRENDETGAECAVRETFEEFGIRVQASALTLVDEYENWRGEGKQALFYVGSLTEAQIGKIEFGDEGQNWQIMDVKIFLESDQAVPHLKQRVKSYLAVKKNE